MTEIDLGPWRGDDFRATVVTSPANLGLNAGASDAARFLASVVRLVKLRLLTDHEHQDVQLPSIFVLEPRPPKSARDIMHVPVINSGQIPVAGKIWFVSEFANAAHTITAENPADLSELFSIVLNELNLGNVPALLFDPRTAANEVRYYPQGLAFADRCDRYDLSAKMLSAHRIFQIIDEVWVASLAVPTLTQPFRIWINASNNVPHSHAEMTIQGLLKTGLQAGIPSCDARVEINLQTGRADIVIEEPDQLDRSTVTCRAILELKVFRSRTSNNKPVAKTVAVKAANDGIDQAQAYAAEKGVPIAALCCFDMRTESLGAAGLTKAVRRAAATRGVEVAVWFMFSSAMRLRQFKKKTGLNFRQHY